MPDEAKRSNGLPILAKGLEDDSIYHDFGVVLLGEQLDAVVPVPNTGTSELRIISIEPDCTCTVLGSLPSSIPAGDVLHLPISMTPTVESENYVSTVAITLEDEDGNISRLATVLRGSVVRRSPQRVGFGTILEGSSMPIVSFSIRNAAADYKTVEAINYNRELLSISISYDSLADQHHVHAQALDALPPGRFAEIVQFSAEGPSGADTFSVELFGVKEHQVRMTPAIINFGILGKEKHVDLELKWGPDVLVTDLSFSEEPVARSSNAKVSCRFLPQVDDSGACIRCSIAGGAERSQQVIRGSFSLRYSIAGEEYHRVVPYLGMIP